MFANLPSDVLCHIRGFAMPVHPCSEEIKITRIIKLPPYFKTVEEFWYDFDWSRESHWGAWGKWEHDESLNWNENAHDRYCDRWALK